jgi:hypothetical protein
MEVYETVKPIDELIPRPTPDEQKAFIERMWLNKDKEEENADKEAIDELSDTPKTGTDDVPF